MIHSIRSFESFASTQSTKLNLNNSDESNLLRPLYYDCLLLAIVEMIVCSIPITKTMVYYTIYNTF